MKAKILALVLGASLAIPCVLRAEEVEYAYDFKVANEDGVELAYRIINKDSSQVAVTYTAVGSD